MEEKSSSELEQLELAPGMKKILEKEYGLHHTLHRAAGILLVIIIVAVIGIMIIFVLRAMGKR